MRKLLSLVVLALVAMPAWAGDEQDRPVKDGYIVDADEYYKELDSQRRAASKKSRHHRGFKATIGVWTNPVSTTVSSGNLNDSFFAGGREGGYPTMEMSYAIENYLHEKDNWAYFENWYIYNGSTSNLWVLSDDPSKFTVGDSFRFRAGRTGSVETGGVPISLEVRPRLGNSRWRLGIGYGYASRTTTVSTDSFEERLVVDHVESYPYSAYAIRTVLRTSRWRATQHTEVSASIGSFLSVGPEFELVSTHRWDLSVEGGVMVWEKLSPDHRSTVDRQYGAFIPERTAFDIPIEQTLLGSDEPQGDGGGYDHGAFQAYLGGRLEYYPLKHFGLGTNIRWYARQTSWSHHVSDLMGPVGIDTQTKRWSASLTLTYAR